MIPTLEPDVPPPPPIVSVVEPKVTTVTFTRPPAAIQSSVGSMFVKQIGGAPKATPDADVDITIFTGLPSLDRMTQSRDSEAQFNERLRQEYFAKPGAPRAVFPERAPVSREQYAGRNFKPMIETIEPGFVMHRRLYFEQPNFDRHGWDLGPVTPFLTAGVYFSDLVTLPYHVYTRPFEPWDGSAGKLLPGDNPPLLVYRPEWSATGLLGQAAAVAGFVLVFP